MKTIVFCGSSITEADASAILPADYRPPAKHGDLISCVYNDQPDIIVLIDGIFIENLTVWHSEINEAINQGVTVYGASALGAVRAAELSTWGMRGVGTVYRMVSAGTIEADDEVFRDTTLSKAVSLVNLRHILSDAMTASLILPDKTRMVIDMAKSLFYKKRTLENIVALSVEQGIITDSEAEELRIFFRYSQRDIQKEDAILCLETVKNLAASDLNRSKKNYDYDLFFEALFERDRGTKNEDHYHSFFHIANDYALYGAQAETLNDAALNRKLCVLIADHFKIQASESDVNEEKKLFIGKHRLNNDKSLRSWLKDNDMSEKEFDELMAERAKIAKLQNWYRTRLGFSKNTRYLLEELKLNDQYTAWKEKSITMANDLNDNRDLIRETFAENDINTLAALFLKRNNPPWAHAPYQYIKKMGISPQAFKSMLVRDKILSDQVLKDLYQSA